MKSFASSTREIPPPSDIPRHIAVIMDGNGRWAKKRYLPRVAGHKQGVETVRRVTRACTDRVIEYLTLFAFSSENWRRPAEEVSTLKQLFMAALEQEAERLHQNKVRLKIIGDIAPFILRRTLFWCSRSASPEQGAPQDNRRYRAVRGARGRARWPRPGAHRAQ